MVHWVYVLECEDDYIYVGETTRLFSRFQEHITHHGGKNTRSHTPQKLIGLYKVNDNDLDVCEKYNIPCNKYIEKSNIFLNNNGIENEEEI